MTLTPDYFEAQRTASGVFGRTTVLETDNQPDNAPSYLTSRVVQDTLRTFHRWSSWNPERSTISPKMESGLEITKSHARGSPNSATPWRQRCEIESTVHKLDAAPLQPLQGGYFAFFSWAQYVNTDIKTRRLSSNCQFSIAHQLTYKLLLHAKFNRNPTGSAVTHSLANKSTMPTQSITTPIFSPTNLLVLYFLPKSHKPTLNTLKESCQETTSFHRLPSIRPMQKCNYSHKRKSVDDRLFTPFAYLKWEVNCKM